MQKQIEQIKEFQKTFGCGVLDKPTVPDADMIILRNNLIKEEVKELYEASIAGDIVECADAITDILYVLLGTACEYGLVDKVEELFNQVHLNNMGKVHPDGTVKRREDGKILKPEGFQKVELDHIVFSEDKALIRNLQVEREILESAPGNNK